MLTCTSSIGTSGWRNTTAGAATTEERGDFRPGLTSTSNLEAEMAALRGGAGYASSKAVASD